MRHEVRAILAIDQGGDSGVAMATLGAADRVSVGLMSNAGQRRMTLDAAARLAGGFEHLVVVLEDHSKLPLTKGTKKWGKGPSRGTAQILGMGGARDRWHEQLDLLGHRKRLRFSVTMADWRKLVLKRPSNTRIDRDEWKSLALQWCERRYPGVNVGHDEAEAVCILEWAQLTRPWEPMVVASVDRQRGLVTMRGRP